jgi:hypothetical protein
MLVFTTCKTNKRSKGDTFPVFVTLNITVKDKTGAIRPNVRVNMFRKQDDYNVALNNGNTSPGYQTGLTNTVGKLTLDSVDANLDQYILATFNDSINQVFYSNRNISSILTKIPEGTIIDMVVTIEPLTATVAFFTQSTDVTVNNIVIKLNALKDTLTIFTTNPAAINPSSADAVVFPVTPGDYTYQAFSNAGCTWTGAFTMAAGGFKPIEISPCNLARVTFYFFDVISTPTVDNGPYDVLIDGVRVGELTDIYGNSGSPTCGLNDNSFAVTAYVDAGTTHTYQIKNVASPCTWISSFTAGAAGSCNAIGLQKTLINSNNCP